LNVKEPWYITDYKLDSISKNLDIWLDFRRGSKFPCPKCGKPNCSFELPLNVKEPWYITDYKLDSISKNLDILPDFRRGSKFPCPKCGKPNCSAYDTKEKVLRHIDYFNYTTYLHCRVP